MALLMPDINLRRAKHHLERYWRQLLGGDRPGERRRLIFRSKSVARAKAAQALPEPANPTATGINSVEVAPSTQDLERGLKMEDPTADVVKGVGDPDQVPDVELDCGSPSVVNTASSNQETESNVVGDVREKSEEPHLHLNQDHVVGDSTAVDNELQSVPSTVVSDDSWKSEAEQPPSSTSTTGTFLSVDSAFAVRSAESTTVCLGKPPLPRSSPEYMPQPKYASLTQGPTLGSILHRVRLNDGDVSELDFSTLAQRNKRLESEGCALVARSLSTNHTVRKLVIRDHAIGDDGAIALSKMLCNNTTLEHLNLYGNEIGDRGVEAIAQALYGHDSLTHLCLNSNRITDRGAEALAQAIRCNCTLKSLELVGNRITRVGAKALIDAVDVSIHLETVNLEENIVPSFVASQLAAALARNRSESLMLESHAAEKQAVKIVRRASGLGPLSDDESDNETEEKEDDDWEDDWEDDDGDSVSSGFLSCSGVTDIPLSSSGLWI
ncbi:hypothetical protein PRNP1_009158 [Phytophthora ramorum]